MSIWPKIRNTPGRARMFLPRKYARTNFTIPAWKTLPPDTKFAYRVTRGYGIDGKHDGLILHNLLASYTHLRTIGSCYWATRFAAFVRVPGNIKNRVTEPLHLW